MKDPTEEIDISTMDRLLGEEVVRHEFDTHSQVRWHLFPGRCNHGLKVLDHKRQRGKLARNGEGGEALRAADLIQLLAITNVDGQPLCLGHNHIYNGARLELSPWEAVDNMVELVTSALDEGSHGISKPAGTFRKLGKFLIDGIFCLVGQCKSL